MRFIIAMVMICCLLSGAVAEDIDIDAKGAVLIEAGSGRVLYGKNENERLPVASTTKIMTALLTLENCGLDETVTASQNASGVPGTSIYLGAGETLTVEQLLYGLMLRSGNDAAVALAEHVAGDVDSFAAIMNREAARLGADANFVNPHGLDADGHEASALAMVTIAREVMEYPVFRTLVSTKSKTIPWAGNQYDRLLTNKNKLLTTYPQSTGIKTGFTDKAGRCLVFSAKRDGMELIGAVLNCANWFGEAEKLLDWGFENYKLNVFLVMGQRVGKIEVQDGIDDHVHAIAPRPLLAALALDEQAQIIIETEEKLIAPVRTGAVIGVASAVVDGVVVASQPLVVERGTEKRTFADAFFKVISRFNPVA
ncbi:MAG: D-alanyl-D-alanine carboxypeptidase family protein [Clostridia bacterium]|nr:D-alanyl-D-alanine carboxypeptidase family protein [Clostridia bacterium]